MRLLPRALFRLIFAIAIATILGSLHLSAQEATPSASESFATVELAPGLTAEVLTGVPTDLVPGYTLYTIRFTFQPGAEAVPHGHPGTTSLVVVSGTLGWTLLGGEATIVRGSASGAPTGTEAVTEQGVEVILEAGDAIYYEDDVTHTARGASDMPTVIHGALLLETGQPLLIPADMDMDMATPAG